MAVALAIGGCGPAEPTEAERNVAQAQAAVRAKLRDPASAQFGYIRAGKPGVMCGRVNSKNGFGGYDGGQQFVSIVDPVMAKVPVEDGGTFLQHDENGHMVNGQWTLRNFSREVWGRYC